MHMSGRPGPRNEYTICRARTLPTMSPRPERSSSWKISNCYDKRRAAAPACSSQGILAGLNLHLQQLRHAGDGHLGRGVMHVVLCRLQGEAVREVEPQRFHVRSAVIAPDAVHAHLHAIGMFRLWLACIVPIAVSVMPCGPWLGLLGRSQKHSSHASAATIQPGMLQAQLNPGKHQARYIFLCANHSMKLTVYVHAHRSQKAQQQCL